MDTSYLENGCHLALLDERAVVLDGEDDGVVRLEEGVVADGPDDVDELDLGGEGVAVEDQGTLGTVPAVQLDGPGR